MNFKKKKDQYEDVGAGRPRPFTGGGLPQTVTGEPASRESAGVNITGAGNVPRADDFAPMFDSLLDSINLDEEFGSGQPSDLSDDFSCIAPREQAMVFDYFRGLNAAVEKMAVTHVEHCHYCREAVGVMGTIMRAAGKECLHPETRGVEGAEAEAQTYQEVID